jgi:hypothetical protein
VIRFKPAQANQIYADTLLIQSNDPDEATVSIPLSGSSGTTYAAPEMTPDDIQLLQNYPNPFNPTTTIHFTLRLGVGGRISLRVHDVLGRTVATLVDGYAEPGPKSVLFDAANLTSGVYYYTLKAGTTVLTRKLLLLR